jgi:hypothetical protein
MQVRNAIVAVTVAAFALTLSACSSDPAPGASGDSSTAPSAGSSGAPASKIRPIQDGFDLANVSATLRSGFPSFAEKSDSEIENILNAACDAMDESGTPQAGADKIQEYGIAVYDAAFSVTAAIQLYCPEYKAFLSGDGTQSNG